MPRTSTPPRPTYPWWIILCLVGLDYFSSLAYLPSIALEVAYDWAGEGAWVFAPLTGVGVVVVTLLAALPVYWYVVGRSPNGQGAIALLEERFHGWRGKLFILAMLGFVATDYILTRTLSLADAATHILDNSYYQQYAPTRDRIAPFLAGTWGERLLGFWTEQLTLTVFLSILSFGLYHYMVRTLSRGFVGIAVGVVVLYLLVNALVIGNGLLYLKDHPALVVEWQQTLLEEIGEKRIDRGSALATLLLLALLWFPPMAIGLSGFELTMASAPSVEGGPGDTPARPVGRIWRTRLLMLVAAAVMGLMVLAANHVVALLVPRDSLMTREGFRHRALSYLAHGGANRLRGDVTADQVSSLFGAPFGTLYDISTVVILCLAGASVTITMRQLIPEFLSRFGMQLVWAQKVGVITHLFNGVILVVTVAFKASVSAQLWAYATSVLALLLGASLAALLDVRARWTGKTLRGVMQIPFLVITALFTVMSLLIVFQNVAGVGIALTFVLVVLVTGILSRWHRSTELRFDGFTFANEESRRRWEEICKLDFQVLVPHDPRHSSLTEKEEEIRSRHRLGREVPILFIEVSVTDPSEFSQRPEMEIHRDEAGREIIRVSEATSVAHVLAAIGLAFQDVGHPPEFLFKWSSQSPMEATLSFLLLGQGNIPFLVRTILRRAQPEVSRRPRVVVAEG